MNSNASRPVPPANTGSALRNWVSDTLLRLIQAERRIDPFIRPAFDAVLRDPLARLTTALINAQRSNEDLKIAEERLLPAEFIVHDGLPEKMRRGIFAQPKTYKAWVRFSGPGPYVTPDIDDVGFMSISVKLMGVPGPKLMDEETFTQDMFGVSTPTFVTPDVRAKTRRYSIFSTCTARIYSTQSCKAYGPRRRAARSKRRISVACLTCLAKARPCSIRSGPKTINARRFRACRCVRPTTTCATPWLPRSRPALWILMYECSYRPMRT